MSPRSLLYVALSVLISSFGCSSEEGERGASDGGGDSVQYDGAVVNLELMRRAIEAGEQGDPGERVSYSPSIRVANIGEIPPSLTGGLDLNHPIVGDLTTLDFDIDGDGMEDELSVFILRDDPITFLAWEDASEVSGEMGTCHLAWVDTVHSWYLFGTCGGESDDEVIVCETDVRTSEKSCSECRGEDCFDCDVVGVQISCVPPEETPDPVEDVGIDVGTDAGTDAVEEVSVDSGGGVTVGECDAECLSQSMAVCCTDCGCEGEVRCYPQCSPGYEWDCETTCCYSYETYECECPDGANWNPERVCCEREGWCI